MGSRGWEDEEPRILTAQREQLRWEVVDLEAAEPAEHRARVIWGAVERLDLGAFYDEIAARGSAPGRAAIDPKVLLALWLYAISEGVGSARHLEVLAIVVDRAPGGGVVSVFALFDGALIGDSDGFPVSVSGVT